MKIYLYNTSGITGNKKAALTPWLKRGACGQVGLLVIAIAPYWNINKSISPRLVEILLCKNYIL